MQFGAHRNTAKTFIYLCLSYIIRYWIDFRVGGRGTVCLSHVVLGDYIIHIFNDEIHMGRNVRSICHHQLGDRTVCLSHVVVGDYIIHIFNDEIHMGRNVRPYM